MNDTSRTPAQSPPVVSGHVGGRPRDSSGWRPSVNITTAERVGRVLIGALATTVGVVLLAGGGTALVVMLELLLVAAGLDLVITGALGHCPLYRKLGHVPASLRRSP